jgi:hypothetical protein
MGASLHPGLDGQQVTHGDHPDQPASLIDHRQRAYLGLLHAAGRRGQVVVEIDGDGVGPGVVGGQQDPAPRAPPRAAEPSTSWLSSRSRRQLLQVAMILISSCLLG